LCNAHLTESAIFVWNIVRRDERLTKGQETQCVAVQCVLCNINELCSNICVCAI